MKPSQKSKIELFKEKFGVNVTIDKNLNKGTKVVHFPKKLADANKLLSRIQVK